MLEKGRTGGWGRVGGHGGRTDIDSCCSLSWLTPALPLVNSDTSAERLQVGMKWDVVESGESQHANPHGRRTGNQQSVGDADPVLPLTLCRVELWVGELVGVRHPWPLNSNGGTDGRPS